MGAKNTTVLAPYGPYWKSHRKIFQQTVGDKELFGEFTRFTEEEGRGLILRLLRGGGEKAFEEFHL